MSWFLVKCSGFRLSMQGYLDYAQQSVSFPNSAAKKTFILQRAWIIWIHIISFSLKTILKSLDFNWHKQYTMYFISNPNIFLPTIIIYFNPNVFSHRLIWLWGSWHNRTCPHVPECNKALSWSKEAPPPAAQIPWVTT